MPSIVRAVFLPCMLLACTACLSAQERPSPFPEGSLKLIQEIDCSQPNRDLLFIDFPKDASAVKEILGVPCRILEPSADTPKFFAYRIGEEMGLKAQTPYVLSIEYPEDAPRAMFIHNWGNETISGFATGAASGDTVVPRYVNHNPESLQYPLSGKFEQWTGFFHSHDRTPEIRRLRDGGMRPLKPEDGFWVIISQVTKTQDPLSNGVAVSKIRLYEVLDESALTLPLNLPPNELPRRRMFWREEMADVVIAMGHQPEERIPERRGLDDIIDWYEHKFKFMQFIGYDTFCTDLLEFGHNQGWDSAPHGGTRWVNQSSTPEKWEGIIDRIKPYGFSLVPYYEYCGSIGSDPNLSLGVQRRAERLDGTGDYTHIWWTEKANVDITDPETLVDVGKILDATLARYKDKADFAGIWFRPRPTANPVGFGNATLRRFSAEANDGNRITRDFLQNDPELLNKYYDWWFNKRKDFLVSLRDLARRDSGNPDAFLLYTLDTSEPGVSIGDSLAGQGRPDSWKYKVNVVTDQVELWEEITKEEPYPGRFVHPLDFDVAVEKDFHHQASLMWTQSWGNWDNKHSSPPPDPERYKDVPGVMLTYTMNKLYSVSNPAGFDTFRAKDGLTVARHYALNEHDLNTQIGGEEQEPTGYFVADVERAGPYSMALEARALALGDPVNIVYLTGNSIQRGFPYYVRRFNQAFHSLPALPSTLVERACADADIVVREIKTENHGTWYAVVNNSMTSKSNVEVRFPAAKADSRVLDAAANVPAAEVKEGKAVLSMYPFEVRTFRVIPD